MAPDTGYNHHTLPHPPQWPFKHSGARAHLRKKKHALEIKIYTEYMKLHSPLLNRFRQFNTYTTPEQPLSWDSFQRIEPPNIARARQNQIG